MKQTLQISSMNFKQEVENSVIAQGTNKELNAAAAKFIEDSVKSRYSYNFSWLGRPIIQYPQDIVKLQEIIFEIKPDLIIETGVAHGGSLVLSASMLALLDIEDLKKGNPVTKRKVFGIDIDIREHNKTAINNHFLSDYIETFEGSSIDSKLLSEISRNASGYNKILVCLDSNHTHDHVLQELNCYSGFVSVGSYCVVFDSIIEILKNENYPDRPWGKGNNPMTAIDAFIQDNKNFVIDEFIDSQLLISAAPRGYLKRIS